jgi:hypothetical protein
MVVCQDQRRAVNYKMGALPIIVLRISSVCNSPAGEKEAWNAGLTGML